MVSQRLRGIAGFSLTEALVVLAAIGIMSAIAIPTFVTYWQAQAIRASAQEVARSRDNVGPDCRPRTAARNCSSFDPSLPSC